MTLIDIVGSRWLHAAALVVLLAGCASAGHRAPVEDRAPGSSAMRPPAVAASASAASAAAAKPPPGVENAGKPGYYTVRPGDTLLRVALDNGQNWRDLARWNNLDNPNVLEVGQVLRVVSPSADANGVVVRPVLPSGVPERRVAEVPASGAVAASNAGSASQVTAAAASGAAASNGQAADGDDRLRWVWPADGPLLAPFDEAKTKGIEIGGKAGDPVLAAADGRVVYAGAGLRGYGNLVIVKHNATYLSAYAHNQTLLVKEDEIVRRGQKIAEMGSSDADQVELHFEIRRQGKPIDPLRLLPPR
ncbi:MAG: peptidoglycan DD-metalloendopeptidase family protein [Burkholderiales bacterium]|nr:peptidoglycan DD-metalloendopeptidase family protein [Burkholderiales bacterium]